MRCLQTHGSCSAGPRPARLLEAHGWTPVHVIVGGNKSLAKQLQKIAQAFGDPRVKAALQRQSSQSGSRTGVQQPAAGAPRGSKLREGWVQWQAPKKDLERQEAGEVRSMSENGRPSPEFLSRVESSMGQRHQGSSAASSPIRSHLPYAGHTHSLMTSLAAAAHQ